MLFFFPRGVLDEILNLIESVSEDFPSYSTIELVFTNCDSIIGTEEAYWSDHKLLNIFMPL